MLYLGAYFQHHGTKGEHCLLWKELGDFGIDVFIFPGVGGARVALRSRQWRNALYRGILDIEFPNNTAIVK